MAALKDHDAAIARVAAVFAVLLHAACASRGREGPARRASRASGRSMIDQLIGAAACRVSAAEAASARARAAGAVTEFIARRYRVSDDAAAGFVGAAYRAGASCTRRPAADPRGDGDRVALQPGGRELDGRQGPDAGHPEVPPREARTTHGGEQALLDPEVNIQVGTRILREYLAPCRRASRPRCRCTPAPSTSRPRSTPARCSRRRRACDRCACGRSQA